MRTRALIATLLPPLLALGCGKGVPTEPAPEASSSPAPSQDHGGEAASQAEIAFAICPQQGNRGATRTTGEVIHIRGSLVDVILRGDLEGEGFGRFDLDLQRDDFTGPARGDFRFELTTLLGEEFLEGGFAGQHHGRQGPQFSGRASGHGFGHLEGLKIRYTFEGRGPGNGFAAFGVITDPSGSLSVPDQPRVAPPCGEDTA